MFINAGALPLGMAIPRCPYFQKCGGCTTQHIEYEIQLENKRKRLGHLLDYDDIKVFSDTSYTYRNRMDFIFHPTGVGLREKGKWHRIVDIDCCVISEDRINELLTEVRNSFRNPDSFDLKKQTGTFRYVVIRTGHDSSSLSFVLNSDSLRLEKAVEQVQEFAKSTSADTVVVTYVPAKSDVSISSDFSRVKGDGTLTARYLGKAFEYSVQGFFQNNHVMAEKMQSYCNELLSKHDTKQAHLLDLYAGVGTFGIVNAGLFKSVTMVESFQACVDAAERNITANGVSNASVMRRDAKQLGKLALHTPLFVITDPPRSGMDPRALYHLSELQPERILYVSCNVKRLAMDIKRFPGYTIESVALFDLFPQTNHIEAVVELFNTQTQD